MGKEIQEADEFQMKLEKIWDVIKGIPKGLVATAFVVAIGLMSPNLEAHSEVGGPSQTGGGNSGNSSSVLEEPSRGRLKNNAGLGIVDVARAGRTVNREVRAGRRDADGIRALAEYLGKNVTDVQLQRVQDALREQFGDDLEFTLVGQGMGSDGLYRAKTIESIDRTPEL